MNRLEKRWFLRALIVCLVLFCCACTSNKAGDGLPPKLGLDPPEGERAQPSLLLDRPVGELPAVKFLDWNDWAGTYEIWMRRREQYRALIQSLREQTDLLANVIAQAARRESLSIPA